MQELMIQMLHPDTLKQPNFRLPAMSGIVHAQKINAHCITIHFDDMTHYT
jgi:hypothetical protein